MGLKENFSQAVKDLTGNSRDDDKRRNSQYEGLKRALDNDSAASSNIPFSEGTSQPYYRSREDDYSRAPQNNPQYNGQSRNVNDGYRSGDRDFNSGGRAAAYDDDRRNDGYRGRDNGYYDNSRQNGYYNDGQRRDGYYGDSREQDRNYGYDQSSGRDMSDGRSQGRDYENNRPQGQNFDGVRSQERVSGGSAYSDRGDNYSQGRAPSDRQDGFNRSYSNFGGNNGGNTYPAAAPQNQNSRRDYRDVADNEITVISKNTMIDGNVRSLANMSIDGDIRGDVETTKDIELNGKIVGNMTCNNANMITSQVQGNLMLKGSVEIGRDTLLIGDLNSGFASINGKVKGNVEITGKAEFKADAVIFGDISASTITVDDGAIIQGYVSTTFLNKDESEKIFPEIVEIGD